MDLGYLLCAAIFGAMAAIGWQHFWAWVRRDPLASQGEVISPQRLHDFAERHDMLN
jgi:hypothetical protein